MEHRQQIWSLKRTHLFPGPQPGLNRRPRRSATSTWTGLNQDQSCADSPRAFSLHPEELVDKLRRHPPRSTPPAPRHLLSPDAAGQRPDGERPDRPERRGQHRNDSNPSVSGGRTPPSATCRRSPPAWGAQPKSTASSCPPSLRWLGGGQNPDMGPARLAQTGGELRHRIRLPRLPARLHLRRPAPVPHPVNSTIPGRRAQQVGRIDQPSLATTTICRPARGPWTMQTGSALERFKLEHRRGSPPPYAPCPATKSNASACLG